MRKLHKKTPNESGLYGLPPQNIEAEAALLSAILIDDRVLCEVADLLAPSGFYRSGHQKIFTAMIELSETQEPIDLVTLANRLRGKGELENVGGTVYLEKFASNIHALWLNDSLLIERCSDSREFQHRTSQALGGRLDQGFDGIYKIIRIRINDFILSFEFHKLRVSVLPCSGKEKFALTCKISGILYIL
jgi:hypothetical protein